MYSFLIFSYTYRIIKKHRKSARWPGESEGRRVHLRRGLAVALGLWGGGRSCIDEALTGRVNRCGLACRLTAHVRELCRELFNLAVFNKKEEKKKTRSHTQTQTGARKPRTHAGPEFIRAIPTVAYGCEGATGICGAV